MLSSEDTKTVILSVIFIILFVVCIRLIVSARLDQDIESIQEVRTRSNTED